MKPSQSQINRALEIVVDKYLSNDCEFDADIDALCRMALRCVLRDTPWHVDEIEKLLTREYDPEIDGDDRNTALRAQEGGNFRG